MTSKYEKGWKDNWSFREKQIIHDHQTKVFCQIGAHDPECFLKAIACKLSHTFCVGKYMAEGNVKIKYKTGEKINILIPIYLN